MNDEQQKNWEFARQLSREARANPDSPYAGKFVGVSGQQVVALADTPEALDGALAALNCNRDDCMVIDTNYDHDRTMMVWSPRLLLGDARLDAGNNG